MTVIHPLFAVGAELYVAAAAAIASLTVAAAALIPAQLEGWRGRGALVLGLLGLAGTVAAVVAAVRISQDNGSTWFLDALTLTAAGMVLFAVFTGALIKVTGHRFNLVAILIVATALAVALLVLTIGGAKKVQQLPGERIAVADDPRAVAIGKKLIWVAHKGGEVTRIDPDTNEISGKVIRLPIPPAIELFHIAVAFGRVWVTDTSGKLWQIDQRSGRIVGAPVRFGTQAGEIAIGEDALWINNYDNGTVTRIHPGPTPTADKPISVNASSAADVALGEGLIWVTNDSDYTITRLNPATGNVVGQPIPMPGKVGDANDVAVGDGSVWVTLFEGEKLVQIDPMSGEVIGRTPIDREPAGVAVGEGHVWVVSGGGDVMDEVDPASDQVVQEIDMAKEPTDVAVGHGAVWITNFAAGVVTRFSPD
jgi:streptogramin lyase